MYGSTDGLVLIELMEWALVDLSAKQDAKGKYMAKLGKPRPVILVRSTGNLLAVLRQVDRVVLG